MDEVRIDAGTATLPGTVAVPADARGIVVFAHGSGSSRHSPRNRQVADGLAAVGLATLRFDLLTEDEARDRANVFDIDLLGRRVTATVDWLVTQPRVGALPVGLFGASTGAAAALDAAGARPGRVDAVVSRGGRVDLAGRLEEVAVPTLLVVGGNDTPVLQVNRDAATRLPAAELLVVPGAGHLFEGPGELEQVTTAAADWFAGHLA